jgi:peptidoglycan/xylan/chitin deacetylase (PgdA/CDA1 family)/CelD/BcsL family acetyltransferase involved in cellulose biosynthesis
MSLRGSPETIAIRIIDDVAAWDALARPWHALFDASPAAATPLQFDWLRTWWRVYMSDAAAAARRLRLFTCWRGGVLVGVLPLYVSSKRSLAPDHLRFVSTGEHEYEETCPDYMNLLAASGHETDCMRALERAVLRERWGGLELLDVPERSPLLSSALGTQEHMRRSIISRGVCPIANLGGGFEAYLGRLSSNTRQHARRLLREADRAGAALELATPATLPQMFDDLIRLHQLRWTAQGGPGVFAAERFTAFHRALLEQWIGDGRAVIARLVVAGSAVAAFYGFVTRGKFDFYQSGVNTTGSSGLRSPGMVGHLMLMRALSEKGVTRYDFLRGTSEYKERLATDRVSLWALQVWRPSARTAAYETVKSVAKRILRRPSTAAAPVHASAHSAKEASRETLVSGLVRSGLAPTLARVRRWRGIMGLTYHRIGTSNGSLFDHGLWSASAEQFDRQVRFLKANCDIVNTNNLSEVVRNPNGRYAIVTFDDGYRDNYEIAFPILRGYRVTANFFVTTGFLDSPRVSWWDEIAWMVRTSGRAVIRVAPYHAAPLRIGGTDCEEAIRALLRIYKTLPPSETEGFLELVAHECGSGRYRQPAPPIWMTWDMVRDMRAGGMAIGGHTVDHGILAHMGAADQRAQIRGCADRLQAELGCTMDSFSYPVGHPRAFNETTRACLTQAGVKYAFSYYGGIRTAADWDAYDIRRIAIESETTFDEFRAITLLPSIFGRSH